MHRSTDLVARLVMLLAATLLALGCADGGSHRRSMTDPPVYSAYDAGPWGGPTADGGGRATDAALVVLGADAGTPASTARVDAGAADSGAATTTVRPGVPALRCGRTYDHETTHLVRGGAPDFATIRHRDGTSLPAEEGSASCGGTGGCTEEVTLLCDGDSLAGVLENAITFSVQGAQSGEAGTGSLVVTVCGDELAPMPYAVDSSTLPGFVNGPQPAAPVSTRERCEVTVRAVGGCVWVRAVTVACATTPPNQP